MDNSSLDRMGTTRAAAEEFGARFMAPCCSNLVPCPVNVAGMLGSLVHLVWFEYSLVFSPSTACFLYEVLRVTIGTLCSMVKGPGL